ncbi:hypothetical protein TNCV_527711 [Trichonephila clavipes]|nr:hypothetical protein TNCV_527711 [Trichonephila clavipes]
MSGCLNLVTAAARGELGIPWDFLHSVLQGLSRATREAVTQRQHISLTNIMDREQEWFSLTEHSLFTWFLLKMSGLLDGASTTAILSLQYNWTSFFALMNSSKEKEGEQFIAPGDLIRLMHSEDVMFWLEVHYILTSMTSFSPPAPLKK